jgi:replicative DNA helicase
MVRALEEGIGTAAAEQRIKVPPNSIEAEQSLIGGLMLDSQAWDKIADVVVAEDFYRKDHQLIYAAIASLVEAGNPCDVVTLSEYLDKRGELEAAGGLEYLATLANETPGAANARAYAKILRDRAVERALIHVGNQITGSAFATDGRSATELVDEAERLVFEIAERGARGRAGFRSLKQILPDAVDRIDVLHQSDGDITGISTGYAEFDKLTAGLQAGDLVIIAGRPSKDDACGECCRECGNRLQGPDRDLFHGDAGAAARLSHDFIAGSCRPVASSYRALPRRGLVAHKHRRPAHVGCTAVHRRHSGTVTDRDSCTCEAPAA